jgi:hypothetical protein
MSETVTLKSGARVRTGGATYEVTETAEVAAGLVPVVPQATRLLKVYCAEDGYTARITQRWITRGIPDCPLCKTPMIVEHKATETEAKPRRRKATETRDAAAELADHTLSIDVAETETETETETEAPSALAQLLSDIKE